MGKLIVIDGLDGSGKSTQCELLLAELRAQGKNVRLVSFPRYESVGSTFVRLYLNGELGGDPSDTNAYAAATFYALDRYYSYRKEWADFYAEPTHTARSGQTFTQSPTPSSSRRDTLRRTPFISSRSSTATTGTGTSLGCSTSNTKSSVYRSPTWCFISR